jgi:hypothetical protein
MTTAKKEIHFLSLFVSLIFVNPSIAQKFAYQEYEIDSVLILKSQISNTTLDLTTYDKSSIVKGSNISYETLKGFWQSYKGLLVIGGQYAPMNLFTPMIIEIDSNKIRHNTEEKFDFFTIKKREIISQTNESFGIINKITDKVLIITLTNNIGVTRYYFERRE